MKNILPLLAFGIGAIAAPAPNWGHGKVANDSPSADKNPKVKTITTYCPKPTTFNHKGKDYTVTKVGLH
jgi:hypothetical protein